MSEQISALRSRLKTGASAGKGVAAPGFLARMFAKAPAFVRRHERFPCCAIAVLDLVDKDLALEGLVTELSQGGALFRPASHFIFDRRGGRVVVRFADDEVAGRIVNVKSHGYGIEFDQVATPERVRELLDRFGLAGAGQIQ
jgi:hypothetical protein